jgi:hypothetical protein
VLSPDDPLKITMVYPDPPGTTSSTLHRINDLDLRVVSPSGTVYHGNVGLDVGTASTPGGAPNAVDTVENVYVDAPEAGVWTVEVTASEINQDGHLATPADDAVFSLVVTGAAETDASLTPGEASGDGLMRVTDYDAATDTLSISYGPACATSDHTISYGELTKGSLAGYSWAGQECGLGTTGTYDWSVPASPESLFFVVVGRSGSAEGSYGLDGAGDERPEDTLSPQCPLPQDLSKRCD